MATNLFGIEFIQGIAENKVCGKFEKIGENILSPELGYLNM